MKENRYEAPQVEILEVAVEKGFALSVGTYEDVIVDGDIL